MHYILFVAIVAVTLGSRSVLATADGPDFFQVSGVAGNDVLNIRSEADPHATKIGEIPADGTCVRNLGCQGGLTFQEFTELSPAEQKQRIKENPRWCKIEYHGISGWVAGRYLQEGGCSK
jgi:hypothetical protein